MLKLYEGTIFLPKKIPECIFIEIIHAKTVTIAPGEDYIIPIFLHKREASSNFCLQEGCRSLMTVNYIKTHQSKENDGVLSYREFQDVRISRQTILKTDIYEIAPPFLIEEYFDGTFLFFKLHCLFSKDEVRGYRFYSEKGNEVTGRDSIYKVYPDKNCALECTVLGKDLIYRFEPKTTHNYPFRFKYWLASEMIHFTVKFDDTVLHVKFPETNEGESHDKLDITQGTVCMQFEDFLKRGGCLHVGTYKLSFSQEFYLYDINM